MYQRINQYDFIEAFRLRDRLDTPDSAGGNFTIDGCRALFEYLTDLEYDLRDNAPDENLPGYELDVIGLCCDFAEYDNVQEAAAEYANPEWDKLAGVGNGDEDRLDWFREQATVIEIPGTDRIIIQQF